MGINFGNLIIDLETLVSSSKEDFSNKFWSDYETYLKKYNELLIDLQSLGFFKNLKIIENVPYCDQSFSSGFSKQEQAKLREISNSSNTLLRKVKLLLSPPQKDIQLNKKIRSNQILIFNRQNDRIKDDVIKFLRNLDLDPILLKENSKKTINKKLKDNSHISFAIALISLDTKINPIKENLKETSLSNWQNIIFELGYLIGKFGHQNVVIIYKKERFFKIPNRYKENIWIEYKNDWYLKLIKVLKKCNFRVNENNISWL